MLRCRKNQATLTAGERAKFVAAVLAMKASGTYDTFVQWHIDNMPNAHRGPAFLPWHREFLRRFELELQAIDASVTLPYWDWTVDNSGGASLWNVDFMGGDGQPSDGVVTTGPFAHATGDWTLALDGPALRRRFGVDVATLPTPADVAAALAETVYDVAPWSRYSASGFRNRLEGWINGPQLHNRVHVWVGGSMAPASSPNDPVFFLNHCFVDKLWADWQALHPGAGYLPASGGPAGHNLNDAMQPWAALGETVTPAGMLDHHALGYAYDTEGVCAPTLKLVDDRPTLKVVDDLPTLKFGDDRPTLKVLDDQPTLKFGDDRPTLKVLDDQPTLKFGDDRPTLKVLDDQGTLKAIDDVQTVKFADDGGPHKPIDDVKMPGFDKAAAFEGIDWPKQAGDNPAGGWPGGLAAPFVLATPHHSMAWTQTFPQAAAAAAAGLQAQVQQLDAAIAEREQAQRQGLLTDGEVEQLGALRRERDAVFAELRQFARGAG